MTIFILFDNSYDEFFFKLGWKSTSQSLSKLMSFFSPFSIYGNPYSFLFTSLSQKFCNILVTRMHNLATPDAFAKVMKLTN